MVDFKRRSGAEDVDCLAMPESLVLSSAPHKLGVTEYTCNPSFQGRGSKFKVISDFKASSAVKRRRLKNKQFDRVTLTNFEFTI